MEVALEGEAALRRDLEDARSSIDAARATMPRNSTASRANTTLARERATSAALRQTLEQSEQRIAVVESGKLAEVGGVQEQSAERSRSERAAVARLTDARTTFNRSWRLPWATPRRAPLIWKSRAQRKPRSVADLEDARSSIDAARVDDAAQRRAPRRGDRDARPRARDQHQTSPEARPGRTTDRGRRKCQLGGSQWGQRTVRA